MLRRSTHGPARRSQAPRRATRGPWPRLRYRLNSSRPFASARTAADRERQAGPICPFIGGLAPAGIPSQALAGSPRGRVPASALRGARSTLGLRVGRHGGAPLVRLRIAPLVHTSRPPRRYQLVRAPRRGSTPALPRRSVAPDAAARRAFPLRLGKSSCERSCGPRLRTAQRDIIELLIPRFPCRSRSGPRASLRRDAGLPGPKDFPPTAAVGGVASI